MPSMHCFLFRSLWMYRNTISELMNVSLQSAGLLRQHDKAFIHSLSALLLRYLVKKSIKRKQRRWILFLCAVCWKWPWTACYELIENMFGTFLVNINRSLKDRLESPSSLTFYCSIRISVMLACCMDTSDVKHTSEETNSC